jgi:integrase
MTQKRRLALPIDYAAAATAENTRLAYRKDLARFEAWGGTIPATVKQVCQYLNAHADTHKVSTLSRWLASISQAHRVAGLESPCRSMEVRRTLNGIKKVHGAKPRRVAPAVRDELMAMIKHAPPGLIGLRNRALLLVGFAGALRRSELAKLGVEDVAFDVRGMILRLGKTKTDQAGENDEIAIPYAKGKHCPVKALKAWLAEAGISEGAIFRPIGKHGALGKKGLSGFSVAQIIKASAKAAGLDMTLYSGHSLRAGLATSSAREKKPFHKIKAQTRHKSDVTLLKYIRDAELFEDNAADLL